MQNNNNRTNTTKKAIRTRLITAISLLICLFAFSSLFKFTNANATTNQVNSDRNYRRQQPINTQKSEEQKIKELRDTSTELNTKKLETVFYPDVFLILSNPTRGKQSGTIITKLNGKQISKRRVDYIMSFNDLGEITFEEQEYNANK